MSKLSTKLLAVASGITMGVFGLVNVALAAINPPTISVSQVSNTSAEIILTSIDPGVTGVTLEKSTDGGLTYSSVGSLSLNQSLNLILLKPGTQYLYRAIATDGVNFSAPADASFTTGGTAPVVVPPPATPVVVDGVFRSPEAPGGWYNQKEQQAQAQAKSQAAAAVLGEKIIADNSDSGVGGQAEIVTTTVAVVEEPVVTTLIPEPTIKEEVVPEVSRLDQLISTTKREDISKDVAEMQTLLREAGFFPKWVKSTGYYGPITAGAIAKYQASK